MSHFTATCTKHDSTSHWLLYIGHGTEHCIALFCILYSLQQDVEPIVHWTGDRSNYCTAQFTTNCLAQNRANLEAHCSACCSEHCEAVQITSDTRGHISVNDF